MLTNVCDISTAATGWHTISFGFLLFRFVKISVK